MKRIDEMNYISNENFSTFYLRLVKLILAAGKSLNQVERELGLPRNALSNYKYRSEPGAYRLLMLAHYFGVSPEYLIDFEMSELNPK